MQLIRECSSRCPGLSRTRDGVLICEVDLNLAQQHKDSWMLQMTARFPDYAKFLADYANGGKNKNKPFKPQVVSSDEGEE